MTKDALKILSFRRENITCNRTKSAAAARISKNYLVIGTPGHLTDTNGSDIVFPKVLWPAIITVNWGVAVVQVAASATLTRTFSGHHICVRPFFPSALAASGSLSHAVWDNNMWWITSFDTQTNRSQTLLFQQWCVITLASYTSNHSFAFAGMIGVSLLLVIELVREMSLYGDWFDARVLLNVKKE